MSLPRPLPRLRDVAGDYDALMCDIWGVIHNGRDVFGAAIEAIRRFQETRGPVALISNSPRPSSEIPAQFAQLGAPRDISDLIVTSGDATQDELKHRAPGPAYKLGPARDEPIYDGTGLDFAGIDEAAFISCTGLVDDATEGPEDYRELLSRAAERGLPMVCANPDIVVQRGDATIWCAGALAQLYEKLGGEVVLAGKPHEAIYRLTFERLNEAAGRAVPRERILAIGDSLGNDIAGANAQGVDALFIGGGIHGAEVSSAAGVDIDALDRKLKERGLTARYAAAALAW